MTHEPEFFKDRGAWRKWLAKNHDRTSEIWVLGYKKHAGVECISYEEALQEALCYGWIDSRLKRIDDERHMWRFAPRKPNSIWSMSNKRRVEQLINEGRMTAHGTAKVEAAKTSGMWDKAYTIREPPRLPKDLKDALREDELAWKNFQAFASSYRHTYIHWVTSAKRDETRRKRIKEVVNRARKNIKTIMY